LYLFHKKALSAPAWQAIHNLTQAAAQGSTQKATASTEQQPAQEYASSESDIDNSLCTEIQEVNDTIYEEKTDPHNSSESDVESDDDRNESTRISSRQRRPPAVFKARPENHVNERKANLLKHYKSDKEYLDDRNSHLNIAITTRFPGHGSFNGKITEYHPTSDNYCITYQDGDSGVMCHTNTLKYAKVPSNTRRITKTNWHSIAPFIQLCHQTRLNLTTCQKTTKTPELHPTLLIG